MFYYSHRRLRQGDEGIAAQWHFKKEKRKKNSEMRHLWSQMQPTRCPHLNPRCSHAGASWKLLTSSPSCLPSWLPSQATNSDVFMQTNWMTSSTWMQLNSSSAAGNYILHFLQTSLCDSCVLKPLGLRILYYNFPPTFLSRKSRVLILVKTSERLAQQSLQSRAPPQQQQGGQLK